MMSASNGLEKEERWLLNNPMGSKMKSRYYDLMSIMLFTTFNNSHIVCWKESVCMKHVLTLSWLLEMSSYITSISTNVLKNGTKKMTNSSSLPSRWPICRILICIPLIEWWKYLEKNEWWSPARTVIVPMSIWFLDIIHLVT